MASWEDNYSSLVSQTLTIDERKEWRFALEEHKKNGTLHLNVRIFQVAGDYQGPTKSGFNLQVHSREELEALEQQFSRFFTEAKKLL